MKRRILSILLTVSLLLGLLLTAALAMETAHPFQDVSTGDWFSEAVSYVYEKGLMGGTTPTTFSPYDVTTRSKVQYGTTA